MLASFPNAPKTYRLKALKIDVFDYRYRLTPPLHGNPMNIRIKLFCQKLESLGYIFVADSVGLSSFRFSWWALKTHVF